MDLYPSIGRRKSCRNYADRPLKTALLDEIDTAIEGFARLYPDVPLAHRFATQVKGLFSARAPHYLIVSGQGRDAEAESAGFLFEQLVLWFDAHDIGCVWLGKAKDVQENPDGKDLIAIAFGPADEPLHRERAAFKRKPIAQITNAPDDPLVQAVHLAPSGMNLQPWYLHKSGEKIELSLQYPKGALSLLYKNTRVDMGIALCHYAVACAHYGLPFVFQPQSGPAFPKGYERFAQLGER